MSAPVPVPPGAPATADEALRVFSQAIKSWEKINPRETRDMLARLINEKAAQGPLQGSWAVAEELLAQARREWNAPNGDAFSPLIAACLTLGERPVPAAPTTPTPTQPAPTKRWRIGPAIIGGIAVVGVAGGAGAIGAVVGAVAVIAAIIGGAIGVIGAVGAMMATRGGVIGAVAVIVAIIGGIAVGVIGGAIAGVAIGVAGVIGAVIGVIGAVVGAVVGDGSRRPQR